MKTSFVVPNVVASLLLGVFLVWAPSFSDMKAGTTVVETFTGIGSQNTWRDGPFTQHRTDPTVMPAPNLHMSEASDGSAYSLSDSDHASGGTPANVEEIEEDGHVDLPSVGVSRPNSGQIECR